MIMSVYSLDIGYRKFQNLMPIDTTQAENKANKTKQKKGLNDSTKIEIYKNK